MTVSPSDLVPNSLWAAGFHTILRNVVIWVGKLTFLGFLTNLTIYKINITIKQSNQNILVRVLKK